MTEYSVILKKISIGPERKPGLVRSFSLSGCNVLTQNYYEGKNSFALTFASNVMRLLKLGKIFAGSNFLFKPSYIRN